jgi:hypothetical protein
MTEQHARDLADRLVSDYPHRVQLAEHIAAALLDAYRRGCRLGARAEREACARLAEAHRQFPPVTDLAEQIRARGATASAG